MFRLLSAQPLSRTQDPGLAQAGGTELVSYQFTVDKFGEESQRKDAKQTESKQKA
jgi:hypothetical protein